MPRAILSLWDEQACSRIHEATVDLLADVGVDVLHAPAREVFAAAGALVRGRRVRLRPELVAAALESAPRSWTVASRGSGATVQLDAQSSYFGTGSDCLYVRDLETGERRRACTADIEGMAALCDRLPNIDFVMSMGLPDDVPQAIDDLAQLVAMLRGTRKPLVVAPRQGDVVADMRTMADLCGSASSLLIYAMPSPPLMHDADALSKVMACAELTVPLIYAPAPNAGATAPRSIAATVVVGNAEVLSGLVLHQAVRPGAPFVYGAGVAAMDMRTASDSYVAPESFLGHQAALDLARWYGLPSFAYAAVSDSKLLDEQWAAEAALTAVLGALSRGTLLHDVGYLESGLQSSYESILVGNELVGYAKAFLKDVGVDEESLALDEIRAAGPGGNHLATRYTRAHHRDFWRSDLFDHAVYQRWCSSGATTLLERARERIRRLVAEPREPATTTDIDAELQRFLTATVERGRG